MLKNLEETNIDNLYNKIAILIENAKRNVAIKVNSEMTLLYWNIGKYITEDVLNCKKAEYGKSVIKNLSQRLTKEYGKGYSVANIFKMAR